MDKNSVETLLTRHYGSEAAAPVGLEQRLQASVRQWALQPTGGKRSATRVMSRRKAVRLVALSSLGVGAVNIGLELLENVLVGQEAAPNAAIP